MRKYGRFLLPGIIMVTPLVSDSRRSAWVQSASKKQQSRKGCIAAVVCLLQKPKRGFMLWHGTSHTRGIRLGTWSHSKAYAGNPSPILTPSRAPNHKGESWLRDMDAEFILLNELANFLCESKIDRGHVALSVEYEPCSSCKSVIEQFREKFPCVNLYVHWDTEPKAAIGALSAFRTDSPAPAPAPAGTAPCPVRCAHGSAPAAGTRP